MTTQFIRQQGPALALWGGGFAGFGAVLGAISTSVSTAGISAQMQKELEKFGAGSVLSPSGYLSFVFVVFIFAVCLFACAQVGAAREEESGQQLETLLAQPVGRIGWLGGRLAVAAVGTGLLSLAAGFFTWAGARSQGVHLTLPTLLEAGGNCVPAAVLFLGIAALAYSLIPRASSALSYMLVSAAFLWYLVGALVGAPRWAIDATPFVHVGLVPAQRFNLSGASVMVAIGVTASLGALAAFRRRDLIGA